MPKRSPHDAYIAAAPAFARPILTRLRNAVRKGCPAVEERLRWGHPNFDHCGLLAGMSAHKGHVNFGFWRGKQLEDPEQLLEVVGKTQMGSMRLEALAELPPQQLLVQYVRRAAALNETRAATPKPKRAAGPRPKKTIATPPDLSAALKRNRRAAATFAAFSYTNQKDYVEWLTEAKRPETRARRLAQALEWMAAGKPRNWKYMPQWR